MEGEVTIDITKVVKAMERIETLFNETSGKVYVSFSGGKESTVILAFIKMCEEIYTLPHNAIPAVFCNTGIELGATVEFVQWAKDNYYSNVQIIRPDPKKPFDWIIKKFGKPIKSKMKSETLHRWHVTGNIKSLRSLVDTDNRLSKNTYYKMRYEMMEKYRPDRAEKFNEIQIDIFDFIP